MQPDVELGTLQKELTKAQVYITKYLMTEEELVRDAEKAKHGAESYQKVAANHQAEICYNNE